MMELSKVIEIYNDYSNRVEREEYKVSRTIDICIASNDAIINSRMIGTQEDIDTWGEFTRRYNNSIEELKRLMGD